MPTIANGKIQYGSGEAMPVSGSAEYNIAQQDPNYLLNFKKANQGAAFDELDMQGYNDLSKEERGTYFSEVPVLSSTSGRTALNEYVTEHNNEQNIAMNSRSAPGTKNQPYDQSKDPQGGLTRIFNAKTGETSYAAQGASLGSDWLTAEEAEATGVQIPPQTGQTNNFASDEKAINEAFNPQYAKYDQAYAKLAETVKQLYSDRIAEAKEASARNVRGTANMLSGFRFSPGSVSRLVSAKEKANMVEIQKISNEEAKLLAEAEVALADKQYQVFADARKEITELRKERIAKATELQKEVLKYKDEERKAEVKVMEDIEGILTDAAKNGAPIEIQNAISSAGSLSEAVAAAGGWLQGGTGIVGEYATYQRDAQMRGLTPMSFDEYQTRDANRKIRLAAATQDPNRILSATEAQALGVPFGTTASQAYGKTPTKPATEAQSRDAIFAQRTFESNKIIGDKESTIASYSPLGFSANVAAEASTLGNQFVSDDIRQTRQAERNFLNAVLRRESGAVISPTEFVEGAKQYFPRPGDDDKTLEQKRQNRETVIANLAKSAGPALVGTLGEPPVGMEANDTEEDALAQLESFKDANPDKEREIGAKIKEMESTLGRSITASEFLQAFPEYSL